MPECEKPHVQRGDSFYIFDEVRYEDRENCSGKP